MADVLVQASLYGISAKYCGARKQRSDGFLTGSQWWWAYELEIWVDAGFFTHMRVEGRTLKVGYNDRLKEKVALFVDAVRNPKNTIASSGLKDTWEIPKEYGYDPRDWQEPKKEHRVVVQLPMQAARGRQAIESLRKNAPTMGG